MDPGVQELRVVVTAPDYEDAVAFYRDALGMPELAAYSTATTRVVILDAGRATLEIADPPHAAFVDDLEVGRRVAGQIRIALQVSSSAIATTRAVAAGAELIAGPTATPWQSLNSRLAAPAGLQLTLFEQLEPEF
ncbi:MAG: VOC family protein [Chloroflexota bacterium]